MLQVRVEASLLPTALLGRTLTGLRLRRPTFLGAPPYPAVQRTLTLRAGFQAAGAAALSQDLAGNRPASLATVFGPAPVAVLATPAPTAGTQVGEEFLELVWQTPLVVQTGNLFLEFEAGDGPLVVGTGNWVDAWWSSNGADQGLAATLGAGTCTTRSTPTELAWSAGGAPAVGGTAAFRLTGAPATGLAFVWLGLAPEARAPGPGFAGFGGSLGLLDPGLVGCHQWAPLDATWSGLADGGGGFAVSFPLAAAWAPSGTRLGVQGGWLDPGRPGLPLSVTNGVAMVVGSTGVGSRCASAFFPGTATWSPWPAYLGQMPVVVLLHN